MKIQWDKVDEAYLSVSDFVNDLAELEGKISDQISAVSMQITKAKIGIPIELDIVVDEAGKVSIGIAPPIYSINTSMPPVFHQIEVCLEKNDLR